MSVFQLEGQERAARLLQSLLDRERIPSAFLFAGPDGTGKALLAREFARALLCAQRKPGQPPCGLCSDCRAALTRSHPDIKTVDAAYQASLLEEEAAKQRTLRVKTIRHLRRDMELESLVGRWKVAVIEDAHALELEAANALLKILEEPPPRTLWVLVTSQRERLPRTVLSRCFAVRCAPLPAPAVERILVKSGVGPAQAARCAALCEGSASRALELSRSNGYPESLVEGPLAPFNAADALPKELYLARGEAELALFALAQDLRRRHMAAELPFSRVEGPLLRIWALRQSLRSNADPRAVLALAALEAQGIARP